MVEYLILDSFNNMMMTLGFGVHLIFIFILFYRDMFISRYKFNENKELIFYPLNNKEGYIATAEQIEKCAIVNKKMSFTFNVISYKKEIEKIFENSQKVNEPLEIKQIWKNSAKKISWNHIFLWFIVSCALVVTMFIIKAYVAAVLMIILLTYPIVPFCIKIMNR